jgi:hypothetical protein
LLIGVIFLLDAMAACPVLHEMIHHDAGKEDHDCAVTMLVFPQAAPRPLSVPFLNSGWIQTLAVAASESVS